MRGSSSNSAIVDVDLGCAVCTGVLTRLASILCSDVHVYLDSQDVFRIPRVLVFIPDLNSHPNIEAAPPSRTGRYLSVDPYMNLLHLIPHHGESRLFLLLGTILAFNHDSLPKEVRKCRYMKVRSGTKGESDTEGILCYVRS